MKPDLKVVRMDTGTSRGRTARETLIASGRIAKERDADVCIVVMRTKNGDVFTQYGGRGSDWATRVGMLEIAKIMDAVP